jgi:hypothetical protein
MPLNVYGSLTQPAKHLIDRDYSRDSFGPRRSYLGLRIHFKTYSQFFAQTCVLISFLDHCYDRILTTDKK